jgi:hypothetical protein
MIRECLIGLSAVIQISITIASPSDAEMPGACAGEPGRVVQCVSPSATDAAIARFDEPHFIFFDARTRLDADLLVFLPGTNGAPHPLPFLKQAADAGYRVVSLAYNDTPSVAVYCPRKPDPSCSEQFRRMRIYGNGIRLDPAIDNTTAESIVNRLVKLLQYLDRHEPQQQWSRYLENGEPNWGRIAWSGQSQGAGMAALIAKDHVVARVILFSSPWDFVVSGDGQRTLAPWLSVPSETPPVRWFAGYNARENTAELIARSYAALRIPPGHIRVFTLELPPARQRSANPFHGDGIRNSGYAEQWAFFLGEASR